MNETAEAAADIPPWAVGAAERSQEINPLLSNDELAVLTTYGRVASFPAGTILWRAGEPSVLYAVLEGSIDVFRQGVEGDEVIVSYEPGHYPGETMNMTGGRTLVSGRAAQDLTAVVVEPAAMQRLIATEADLGEKMLHSFILRRMRMVAENLGNVTLIGHISASHASGLQSFLSRSGVPFDMLDAGDQADAVAARLKQLALTPEQLPVVVCNEQVLVQPTNRAVAECLGFTARFDCGVTYDVAVVGSGPAGLAAAVYAASEGLSVLVLESCATGGQAGSSSKIENYMGFPTGISGQALMGRAYLQAQKFGAAVAVARELEGFECGDPWHKLRVDGGDLVFAKAVVIATGAIYRQPDIERLDQVGGVHYGASHIEGQLCRGQDVAIVGGGNSAGQAAVYLSRRARSVHILIRGGALSASMSNYLVRRIDTLQNVHLHPHSEIDTVVGADDIEAVVVRNNRSDQTETLAISRLFIFIGAQPGTAFVGDAFALDEKGFILTGDQLDAALLEDRQWPLERRPYLLESSCPRVFAAGDVRSGSIKRVASAVGEGSVCVQFIHNVLSDDSD